MIRFIYEVRDHDENYKFPIIEEGTLVSKTVSEATDYVQKRIMNTTNLGFNDFTIKIERSEKN